MERQGTNRPDLADGVVEYSAALTHLMGTSILPVRPVATRTGEFDKIEVSQAKLQTGDLKRSRKAAYPTIEHTTTSDNWACVEYALSDSIDRHLDKPELDRFVDSEQAIANLVTRHLMKRHEKRVAAAVFNATTMAGKTADVGTEWNNAGNPYNDVQDAILTLLQQLGGVIDPGGEICLAFSHKVRNLVLRNTNVKALLAGGSSGPVDFGAVSNERLAGVLDVDRIFTSPARDGSTDIWDDEYALLFVRRTDDTLANGVQFGRSFIVDDSENMAPWGVVTFEENNPPVNAVAVWHQTDEKLLTLNAGYLLSNITT